MLDVTTGSGAFIKDIEGSKELARRMTAIGKGAGKETVAVLTSMEEPLGEAVGNNLEVIEAVKVLQGGGPEDVKEVCLALAGMMLSLGYGDGQSLSYEEGRQMAEKALVSGQAYEKFKAMVQTQGGDVTFIENPDKFAKAAFSDTLTAWEDGYITSMNTEGIGVAAGLLGAGRETKESEIDFSAGIQMKKKIGDAVKKGDVLAVCHAGTEEKLQQGLTYLRDCILFSSKKPEPLKLVVDIVR